MEKLAEINTFRVRTTVSEIAVFSWRVTVPLDKKKDAEQREKLPELSCPILRDVKIPKFLVQNEKWMIPLKNVYLKFFLCQFFLVSQF